MRKALILSLLLLGACSAHRQPLIGITCSRSSAGSSLLSTTYSEAIRKAGAIPVAIPTVSSAEEARAVIDVLDGIVFSGGEDVCPAWYGEAVLNETVEVDTLRDFSDSLLAKTALASGKPILAICRGEQLLNVVMGGSLYQDIPAQLPQAVTHGGGALHKIKPQAGTVLARLYGTDSLEVNSYHHQAVKDPAPGIRIAAYSPEGIVEAYETDQVLAVQFHPEKDLKRGDDRWLPLFQEFISRCK